MSNFGLKRAAARAAAFAGLCLLLAGCGDDEQTPPASPPLDNTQASVWVAIEPTQCLTNAWEADWLAHHDDDYAAYPKDYSRPGLEPEELAIIKDYYARQGVVVRAGATAPKYEAICAACSCPEGHTMFLLVRASDVDTMVALGYRVEAPPETGSVLTRLPD